MKFLNKKQMINGKGCQNTIPVFFEQPGTLYVSKDGGALQSWRPVPMKKSDIDLKKTHNGIKLYDAQNKVIIQNGLQTSSVWDKTFDKTFRVIKDIEVYIKFELTVNKCTEGIYLRWVNKFGDFCYWLFNPHEEKNEVKDIGVNIEEFITTTDFVNGFHVGTNHPKGKEAQRLVTLYANLVDSETFDFLTSLAESPVVDLYCGDGNWVRVNIAPANVVKSNDELQDFICTLVSPRTFNQEL